MPHRGLLDLCNRCLLLDGYHARLQPETLFVGQPFTKSLAFV